MDIPVMAPMTACDTGPGAHACKRCAVHVRRELVDLVVYDRNWESDGWEMLGRKRGHLPGSSRMQVHPAAQLRPNSSN